MYQYYLPIYEGRKEIMSAFWLTSSLILGWL
jgi:hypothetical protein